MMISFQFYQNFVIAAGAEWGMTLVMQLFVLTFAVEMRLANARAPHWVWKDGDGGNGRINTVSDLVYRLWHINNSITSRHADSNVVYQRSQDCQKAILEVQSSCRVWVGAPQMLVVRRCCKILSKLTDCTETGSEILLKHFRETLKSVHTPTTKIRWGCAFNIVDMSGSSQVYSVGSLVCVLSVIKWIRTWMTNLTAGLFCQIFTHFKVYFDDNVLERCQNRFYCVVRRF